MEKSFHDPQFSPHSWRAIIGADCPKCQMMCDLASTESDKPLLECSNCGYYSTVPGFRYDEL